MNGRLRGQQEQDTGFALDCAQLGLVVPADLAQPDPVRPGETLAAVYVAQAVSELAALTPVAREAVGGLLRGMDVNQESVLRELDVGLYALSEGLREADTDQAHLATRQAVLEFSRHGGQRINELHSRSSGGSILHDADLGGSQQFELTCLGVKPDEQAVIARAIHWLQLSFWAMACAEERGRQYIACILGSETSTRPCAPEHADRLLLRLGANRLLWTMRSHKQVGLLPPIPERLCWFTDLSELNEKLRHMYLPSIPISTEKLASAADRAIELEGYRYYFAPGVRRAREMRDYRSGTSFTVSLVIDTPVGILLGTARVTTETRDTSTLELHIPLLEDRPNFMTDLESLKTAQLLQSLVVQGLY